jgi:serine/threonine protein kinase
LMASLSQSTTNEDKAHRRIHNCAAMSLESGTKFGHYEIRSKLGVGGMGEVYLAEDTKLHRKIAVKFLTGDFCTDEKANKRLLLEARAAAVLDHPNICSIYEVGEDDGRTFIVMPFIEGETLDARIRRKPLQLRESLAIAAEIAEALAEAHAHGIIHRDIKPSNIMITSRGHAKVMDFGLAKLTVEAVDREAETQSLLTTPGAIIGTIPYMSPEQVRGEHVDSRTDVFSFGVVVYEMLTKHQPFAMSNPVATISAILTLLPKSVEYFCREAPEELSRLVEKCLEKDRELRYRTMREVATDLEGACRRWEQKPVSAPQVEENSSTKRRNNKPINSSAYDYYLRGKVNVGSQNLEANESAIKLLERAVETDPSFAPAYAALARAYSVKAFFFASDSEKKKLNEDAKVAVEKSLALDPDLAEGHVVRGYVLWTHANRFPHEQAILSFKRAIALEPTLHEAHNQLAYLYYHIGLLDKAWQEFEQTLTLNPSETLARFGFGLIHLCRANYEDALAVFKTVPQEANPGMVDGATAMALLLLDRVEEASEVVEDYLRFHSPDVGANVTSVKAVLLAKAGAKRAAEDTIQLAIDSGRGFQHFHHATYNLAAAYALLDKPAQAIKWLQFTADDGFPCYPLFESNKLLRGLRKDDRFVTFMTHLKGRWQRYEAML